jgi:hypothetical protein
VNEREHARIEELLAGYALRSLEGDDAAEADRLLADHVPTCAACRETLGAFARVAGDLALAAPVIEPPETLLPRLQRELEPRVRRFQPARLAAIAASVALVVVIGGVGLSQLGRDDVPLTQLSAQDLQQAVELSQREDARTTDLGAATEVSAPGLGHFFVYGTAVPAPAAGSVYRLWLIRGAEHRYLGDFVPSPGGDVVLRVDVDPSGWERVLVTMEPAGSEPSSPGQPAWQAAG